MNAGTTTKHQELAVIGSKLRQQREAKGLSLRQVHQATLIPEHHLRAIEAGDWSQLPEPVYVQGFIRKYAQFLGLEDITQDVPLVVTNQHQSWTRRKWASLSAWHLYGLYIGGVVAVVLFISYSMGQNYHHWAREATTAPAPTLPPPPSPEARAVPTPAPIDRLPLHIGITIVGESWIRVTIDGNVVYEGIVSEGKTMAWAGKQEIRLRVGNAAGVSVSVNGGTAQVVGGEGEVVEKSYTVPSSSPRSE